MSKSSQKYTGSYLANSFIEYYESRGHTVRPSADLVPEDPTLLFTAAGMVPFKEYYNAPDKAPFATACSVQKCLRAGGKQSEPRERRTHVAAPYVLRDARQLQLR